MTSLCFADAGWARTSNKISAEVFYGHLLAHFRGVWHAADDRDDLFYLSIVDPVCASLKRMMLKPDFKTVQGRFTSTSFSRHDLNKGPIADTAPHERLLLSCSTGMLDDVKSVYQQMKRGNDQVPLQPMAAASASKGHADVFRYCLQEGAVIDPDVDQASGLSDNPDMLKVLFEADWRNAKSDQKARDKLLVSSLNNGRQQVAFLLDQGARIQPEAFVRASFNPPSGADVSTVALLLSRGGQPKDSGALQLAAGRGRLDVVEVLLNAGADIDEIPANAPGDVMDGWPQTALHEAIAGKRVDVVRLLLSRGARLDVRDDRGQTALERARARGQSEILELCEEKSRTEGTDFT